MFLGGFNQYKQLGEDSNGKDIGGDPCICKHLKSHLNTSSLLSFSAYGLHSLYITTEGRGFAIGTNKNCQIIGTLPKGQLDKEEEVRIEDKKGRTCKFISAVCGFNYTLYLVSFNNSENNRLAYVRKDKNSGQPCFVNINGHNPIHLFGGSETAAVIDSEGSIFIITNNFFDTGKIEESDLPSDEYAIDVACCNKFVIVLSSSGKLFFTKLEGSKGKHSFTLVSELEGIEISQISGTYDNCLAVSKDGRVFGRGSNSYGQLGLGEGRSSERKFTQITIPNGHKIISASIGYNHSLFITSERKVLTCGSNFSGQLLLDKEPSVNTVDSIVETVIKSGASFCIAGNYLSVVFCEGGAPINTPNMTISDGGRIRSEKEKKLKELEEE